MCVCVCVCVCVYALCSPARGAAAGEPGRIDVYDLYVKHIAFCLLYIGLTRTLTRDRYGRRQTHVNLVNTNTAAVLHRSLTISPSPCPRRLR